MREVVTRLKVLLALFLLGIFLGLQPNGVIAQEAKNPTVPHVIHISVDALGGKYLRRFVKAYPEEFPNFNRLVNEGAATFNARTDYFRTTTLQNHTSMVTGRPVLTPDDWKAAQGHHWVVNFYPKSKNKKAPETLHLTNPEKGYTSSTFDVAHDNGLETAMYSGKSKFQVYAVTYGDKFGAENEHGRNKIDHVITGSGIHAKAMADLKKHSPNYVFLHYPDPDAAGHAHGYLGEDYRTAVRNVDGYLGDLLDFVNSNLEWRGRTIIILSADHGGKPGTKGHGDAANAYDYTLPFIVWGRGVAHGADLYDLNKGVRTDPGTGRPEYAPTGQPIRNGGGGNLALNLLGLPAVPGSSINNNQDLRVR